MIASHITAQPDRPAGHSPGPTVGAFVQERTWRAWNRGTTTDVCRLLAECGVNRFMTETWHLDARLVDTVHSSGMSFWTSVACYSDHAEPVRHARPELVPITAQGDPRPQMEWYGGLVPTDAAYNDSLADRCAAIAASFDVDGFCLDFMRWPLHWEIELRDGEVPIETSFDATSLAAFRSRTGLPAPRLVGAAAAARILESHLDDWVSFKCAVIVDNSRRIIEAIRSERPELRTGLFVVPGDDATRRRHVGQDVSALGAVFDELLPMAYHRILHRSPSWIAATVEQTRLMAGAAACVPVVQITAAPQFADGADWGTAMAAGEPQQVLETALRAGAGVVAFPAEAALEGAAAAEIRTALRRCSGRNAADPGAAT